MSVEDDAFIYSFVVTKISRKICELWRKLKEYFRNLNIFPSVPPSTEEYALQTQRISTRLFIIIFLASLAILLLYTALIKVRKIVTVKKPTFIEYAPLSSTYSQSLRCPCSKISINYGEFLHVDYTLHQVCSSIYVDEDWMKHLMVLDRDSYHWMDFRWTGIHAFQALKSLCDLIKETISYRLIQFYSNQYVTLSIVPETLLKSQTQSFVDQMRSSLTNNFLLSLAMIRDATQANALMSTLQNNYYLNKQNSSRKATVHFRRIIDCLCSFSFACISQSSILDYPSTMSLFDIPNFYTGCYVIESLLQSNLQCFYTQECIVTLRRLIVSSSPMTVTALNASSSVYSKNSTIQKLVDNLMIEQWNTTTVFESYYSACRPIQCTYTLETNNDMIYIFTTLFGIAGGLTTILKLILPRLIEFIRKKQRQQHVSQGK